VNRVESALERPRSARLVDGTKRARMGGKITATAFALGELGVDL
jgi:hypothetical protein